MIIIESKKVHIYQINTFHRIINVVIHYTHVAHSTPNCTINVVYKQFKSVIIVSMCVSDVFLFYFWYCRHGFVSRIIIKNNNKYKKKHKIPLHRTTIYLFILNPLHIIFQW